MLAGDSHSNSVVCEELGEVIMPLGADDAGFVLLRESEAFRFQWLWYYFCVMGDRKHMRVTHSTGTIII